MIVNMLKGFTWRELLVPVGAAMLAAGARHLEERADAAGAGLEVLESRIAFRREQIAGTRDLWTEPEPEPVDQVAAEPVDEPGGLGKLGKFGVVAVGLGMLLPLVVPVVRQLAGRVLDQFDEWPPTDLDRAGAALAAEMDHVARRGTYGDEPTPQSCPPAEPPADDPGADHVAEPEPAPSEEGAGDVRG